MRIISWNINGIRAIYKRNFLDLFREFKSDIICLQETKAWPNQLPQDVIQIDGYYSYFNSAKKKGYSGVAVYSKRKPLVIKQNLGMERFDKEGRFLGLDFENFSVINLYFPHGGRKKENLDYKLEVYEKLLKYLSKVKAKKLIVIGDFNIAHTEIDLARPKENKNNIMFTPKEREKINQLIKFGFTDTFRKFHPEEGCYTWWPYYLNARERNLGWRLDYCFISNLLKPKIKDAFILSKIRGSDHCPIGIESDL